jgi:hypothetical protein
MNGTTGETHLYDPPSRSAILVLGHFPVDSTIYYPLGFPGCQV